MQKAIKIGDKEYTFDPDGTVATVNGTGVGWPNMRGYRGMTRADLEAMEAAGEEIEQDWTVSNQIAGIPTAEYPPGYNFRRKKTPKKTRTPLEILETAFQEAGILYAKGVCPKGYVYITVRSEDDPASIPPDQIQQHLREAKHFFEFEPDGSLGSY